MNDKANPTDDFVIRPGIDITDIPVSDDGNLIHSFGKDALLWALAVMKEEGIRAHAIVGSNNDERHLIASYVGDCLGEALDALFSSDDDGKSAMRLGKKMPAEIAENAVRKATSLDTELAANR